MKFGPSVAQSLTQSPQNNPIRWEILKKVGEGKFNPQSTLFMCKDYFNDICWKRQRPGKDFSVYGFNTSCYTPDPEGVYVRVHFINNQESFAKNVEVINESLGIQEIGWFLEYQPIDKTTGLLFFPDGMFTNTYHVSLITWMLRLGNYGDTFSCFDDFFAVAKKYSDCSSAWNYIPAILKHGFNHPKIEYYIYYYNDEYNSKQVDKNIKNFDGYTTHNAGVANWWSTYIDKVHSMTGSFFKKAKVVA